VPTKVVPLGEWLPDLPGGLSVASNVRAIENGYAPVKALLPITPSVGQFNGGGAFVASDGSTTLLTANLTSIYKYNGTEWDFALAYGAAGITRMAQFGDNVMAAGGATVIGYVLTDGSTFIPTDAPELVDVAQVRDFVMGITTDNKVQWCQFNNSSVWTTGANQADVQPSLWGALKRVVGGEYAIILTDQGVVRGTYVGVEGGLDIIWQFDQISAEVGCMAEGSVCNVGRLVFFLSERGFMMCDGNEVTPIADEKFNRWFFDTFSRSDISNIWSAIDPRNSTVLWAMSGTPGTIIAYNWVLKRATTYSVNVRGMFTGYTAGTSLDALGNIDALTVSLDDPSLQGGNPVLLVIDGVTGAMSAMAGGNMETNIRLENIEPTPGRRSRIRTVRLVSDATDASATIDARMRAGDAEYDRSASTMRSNGKLPIRSNGRYNTLSVTIPAGTDWSFIQGVEIEYEAGDGR
jgi:hypothetical protein